MDRKFFMLGPEYGRGLVSFDADIAPLKLTIIGIVAVAGYVFPTKLLQDTAVAAAALVLLDTATGVAAAFVEKHPRTSAAFARVIAKAFAYLSVCIVAAVVERTILRGSGLSVTMAVLWLVIATEGISIIENVERISGGRFHWLRRLLGRVVEDDEQAGRDGSGRPE